MTDGLGPDDTKTVREIKKEIKYLSLLSELLNKVPGSDRGDVPQTYAGQNQQYESQIS